MPCMQEQEINKEKRTKFSKKEAQQISVELNKYLGPELISYRAGMGGVKLAYTEGWTIVNIANKIFGFDGWSSEVIALETDFIDEKKIQGVDRYSVGISCRMRISLKDGTKRMWGMA